MLNGRLLGVYVNFPFYNNLAFNDNDCRQGTDLLFTVLGISIDGIYYSRNKAFEGYEATLSISGDGKAFAALEKFHIQ